MAGAGKGDRKRPLGPGWDHNFDRIFGKKCSINHAHSEDCYKEEEPSKEAKEK